jgi:hypothetical protein
MRSPEAGVDITIFERKASVGSIQMRGFGEPAAANSLLVGRRGFVIRGVLEAARWAAVSVPPLEFCLRRPYSLAPLPAVSLCGTDDLFLPVQQVLENLGNRRSCSLRPSTASVREPTCDSSSSTR